MSNIIYHNGEPVHLFNLAGKRYIVRRGCAEVANLALYDNDIVMVLAAKRSSYRQAAMWAEAHRAGAEPFSLDALRAKA